MHLNLRRQCQGTSRFQAESLRASSYEHIPMEVQPVYLPWTHQSEDTADDKNILLNNTHVNGCICILNSERHSLLFIQREQDTKPKEGGVSYGVLWDFGRAICGTSSSQELPLTSHSYEYSAMEVPGFLSRSTKPISESVPLCQCQDANSICQVHQKRLQNVLKPYTCEECPRALK